MQKRQTWEKQQVKIQFIDKIRTQYHFTTLEWNSFEHLIRSNEKINYLESHEPQRKGHDSSNVICFTEVAVQKNDS